MSYKEPKEKTKENYSKIHQLYISDFSEDYSNFELLDKLVEILRERRMLLQTTIDIGSGPGTVTQYLVKKGLSRIVAIDITPEFCDYMRKKFKKTFKGVQFGVLEGDMVDILRDDILPVNKSNIAAVTAGFSIIHIPDNEVDGLLQNIYDLLFPGGLFYMSCYEGTHKGMETEQYVLQKDTRLKTQERFEVYTNYFTEEELRERIERVGFHILDLKRFKPRVIPGEIPVSKLQVLVEKSAPIDVQEMWSKEGRERLKNRVAESEWKKG